MSKKVTQIYKNFKKLKTIKFIKADPKLFGSSRNHHQGATTSALLKLHILFNSACRNRSCQVLRRHNTVQRGTSLRSEPHTHTHTRSQYAAITLTTSAPTSTVEQDL